VHNFTRECQSHWHKNFLPYICYVATIPCKNVRHKSNTFHTNISTLHMFILITFTENSIDEKNKTQQKVRGSKFMFKMSIIHANTCIQTTMPLCNRCRDGGVHGAAASTPSADVLSTFNVQCFNVLSTPSHHGSTSGRPSLEAYPRCCSPLGSNLAN